MLFDLGPHLVDQVLALFGPPQSITASVRIDREDSAIEDVFDIALHYPKLMAYCRATMIAADPAPRFLLHGTGGSFRKYGLDPQEPTLVAGAKVPRLPENGKPTDEWLSEDPNLWGMLTLAPDPADPRKLVTHEVETELGDYRGFYANVRDAIRGTAPLAVTPEAAYQTIKLLELARQSSESGRTLPVAFASFG
jgi:predicted dehydrogenase